MRHRHPPISQETPTLCTAQSRGFFLSCGHTPHQRAMWRRKWSTTEKLRPHCCSRQPPSSRRSSVCSRFRLRFKLHSAGMWDRSSPSSSLSAQFSLSYSSLALTSRGVSRFCGPSNSFASKGRFLRRVGRFFPKAARFGSKSSGFSPEGAALLPISPSFFGTARGGVQKNPPLSA